LNSTVLQIREAGITPNFHAAEITWFNDTSVIIVCSTSGNWALAERITDSSNTLSFIDSKELSSALSRIHNIRVWTAQELNAAFAPRNDISEHDVKYWEPETIGEGLFNWWD
jgi:hypothetical protein